MVQQLVEQAVRYSNWKLAALLHHSKMHFLANVNIQYFQKGNFLHFPDVELAEDFAEVRPLVAEGLAFRSVRLVSAAEAAQTARSLLPSAVSWPGSVAPTDAPELGFVVAWLALPSDVLDGSAELWLDLDLGQDPS